MNNSIEIAIATYNRANILALWLEKCYKTATNIGFVISVYDSSTNDDTAELIATFNRDKENKVKYVRVDTSVRLDDKIMMSLLETECDYVWPLGDSRVFDFCKVEKKVIPFTDNGYDIACLWGDLPLGNDGKTYTNVVEFFNDCFWHATWLGGIIYKRTVFDFDFQDDIYIRHMSIFNRNDGFSNNGIMFNVLAKKNNLKISVSAIGRIYELSKCKEPGWLKRYIEVWGDNLCYMIDNLDERYNPFKEKVLKEVWEVLDLDKAEWCYRAKKAGGLTPEIYEYYDSYGLLDRVSNRKDNIRYFAFSSEKQTRMKYLKYKTTKKLRSGIRKIRILTKRAK